VASLVGSSDTVGFSQKLYHTHCKVYGMIYKENDTDIPRSVRRRLTSYRPVDIYYPIFPPGPMRSGFLSMTVTRSYKMKG
jgi:hypothetical protein